MFIVNGKSHCCNGTSTNVRFTSLLAKNIEEKFKLFYAVRISILLAILSKIFIPIGYFQIKWVMQENKSGCFFLFWTQCSNRSLHGCMCRYCDDSFYVVFTRSMPSFALIMCDLPCQQNESLGYRLVKIPWSYVSDGQTDGRTTLPGAMRAARQNTHVAVAHFKESKFSVSSTHLSINRHCPPTIM